MMCLSSRLWLGLGALLLVASAATPAVAGGESRRLVVVLYPQGSNAAVGNRMVEQAISAVFNSHSPDSIDVYNEYLELSSTAKADLLQLQTEFLRRKYAGRKVALVMTCLSPSLRFALKHRAEIFPGVPIVFLAVEERELHDLKLPPDVIGAPVNLDLTGTLDLALQLRPRTQHVYVVSGVGKFDAYWEAQAKRAFQPYENKVDFTYLTGLTTDELSQRVAHLPEHSQVYFLFAFQDRLGKELVPADVVERLAQASNAPIYSVSESFLGRGIVGGKLVGLESEAREAAGFGLRILSGEFAQMIGVQPVTLTVPMFDWRQLQRWGIREASLPAGSVVRYREAGVWELYKWPIVAAVSLCSIEALLIASLLVQMVRRRRANLALRESEQRFRLMADTAPVQIWMSGPDKKCTYFNRPWLDFTGRSLAQELGDGWAEGVHADDLARCIQTYERAFDAREPFRMEYRLRRHDGEYRWILDIGVARRGAAGTFEGYIGSCLDITDQKRVEEAIRDSQRELRLLSGRLIKAQETERRRIARELHDDLSQSLALLAVKIEMLRQQPPVAPAPFGASIDELSAQVKQLSSSVHNLSYQLHPLKLEQLGLVAAIRSLCGELSRSHGVSIDFTHNEAHPGLSDDVASCLYRIVQESARNMIKHSGARQAHVELNASIEEICLRIADDGAGFDPRSAAGAGGLGLVSMRERLQLVGGTLSIDSRPAGGTRIDARIPLYSGGRPAKADDAKRPDVSHGTVTPENALHAVAPPVSSTR
jgi:PAS domain S-box-containing protein